MLPQPYTAAQLEAEAAEGAEIMARLSAELRLHHEAVHGSQKSAIELLGSIKLIGPHNHAFHNKVDAYLSRSDLKLKYSSRQIQALAAAEILHPHLDLPPDKFHGLFVWCCVIAETTTPAKLNHGKNRVTFRGIDFSRFL